MECIFLCYFLAAVTDTRAVYIFQMFVGHFFVNVFCKELDYWYIFPLYFISLQVSVIM